MAMRRPEVDRSTRAAYDRAVVYQIGKGYYGVTTEPGSSSAADREEAARVFREVFSVPADRIRIEPTAPKPARPASRTTR